MLRPVGNAVENLLDPFEDLGRFAGNVLGGVESAGANVAELFDGAVVHRFSEGDNAHGFEQTYLPRRVPFEQARRGDFD